MFLDFAKEITRIHNEYGFWVQKYVNSPNSVYKFCMNGYPHIVKSVAGIFTPVRHVNAVTGFTDGKTIYVPKGWFYDKFYDEVLKINIDRNDLAYTMIGVYDGLLVHEALHIRLTSFNQDHIAEILNELNTKYSKNYSIKNKFIQNVFNVVEDIYIERWCSRHLPYYWSRMNFLNGILFHERAFEERLEAYANSQTPEEFISNMLNLIICYKTFYYADTILETLPEIAPILVQLDQDLDEKDRWDITYQILEMMPQEAENQDGDGEEGEDGESGEGSGKGKPVQDKLDELTSNNSMTDEEASQYEVEHMDYNGERISEADLEAIGRELDKIKDEEGDKVSHEMKKIEDTKFTEQTNKRAEIRFKEEIKRYKINGDKRVQVKIVNASGANDDRFKIDMDIVNDFRKVGREFVRIRAKEKNTSQPQNKGRLANSLLTKIPYTDNVARQRQHNMRKYTSPEVVILLDISGSTVGMGRDMKDLTLLEFINNAGYGMFQMLADNNVSSAVYAHTTEGYNDCAILPVVAHNHFLIKDANGSRASQTTVDKDQQFKNVLKYHHGGNADATAISFLNRFGFSNDDNKTKILIVVSDGEPSQGDASIVPNFKGEALDELVKALVENIREDGRYVFSVSVTPYVIKSNDYIYGKQWNIDASNVKNYSAFQGLVERIVMG